MKLIYDEKSESFILYISYYGRNVAKQAGFQWNPDKMVWYTKNVKSAMNFWLEADSKARRAISYQLALESTKSKKEVV